MFLVGLVVFHQEMTKCGIEGMTKCDGKNMMCSVFVKSLIL